MTEPLVLIGPPGAGKTTVGRRLAARLERRFLDTDERVSETAGMSVAEIFVERGEDYFRELEEQAVRAALAAPEAVVALGGGAVLRENVRAALRTYTVVFLDVSPEGAFHRVGLDRSRPLLALNPRRTLRELMAERRPLYAGVATLTVATDDRTPDQVVDELVAMLQ